jgi:hypothetical protein
MTFTPKIKRKRIVDALTPPVTSPEHLIALKLFAALNDPERKFKELSDIEELLRVAVVDNTLVKNILPNTKWMIFTMKSSKHPNEIKELRFAWDPGAPKESALRSEAGTAAEGTTIAKEFQIPRSLLRYAEMFVAVTFCSWL